MPQRLTLKNHWQELRLFSRRMMFAMGVILLLILILLVRLAYLQIYKHSMYTTLSRENSVNVVPIAPSRGLIFDRNGVLLAENVPSYNLEIVSERVDNLADTMAELKKLLPISPQDEQLFYKLQKQKHPLEGIPIRMHLTEEEVATFAVNRYRFPGVSVEARLIRHYPLADTMVSALGYVGRINDEELANLDPTKYSASQFIGKLGVEKFYEPILHGNVGHQEVETDAHGRVVRVLDNTDPSAGDDLTLTLDANLQKAAQAALTDLRGAVVAIDPRNGEILALVSNPSYDPNLFVTGIPNKTFNELRNSPDQPLYNRAIRGLYPPGSSVKPLVALQGLDTNTITPDTTIFDPGWFKLKNSSHLYRESLKKHGHGMMSLNRAIYVSCDVYFYNLAHRLEITKLDDIFKRFGLGQPTGLDVDEELAGNVPSPAWKQRVHHGHWYPGETIITGIGQGYMLATPMQLAYMAATIAAHGQRFIPHLLLSQHNHLSDKTIAYRPKKAPPVLLNHPEYWGTIITAMQGVVDNPEGTANRISHGLTYTIAGKTGTAQVFSVKQGQEYHYSAVHERLRDHSWFIGFAPVDKPQIAIAVLIENAPKYQVVGSTVARQLLDSYFKEPGHAIS